MSKFYNIAKMLQVVRSQGIHYALLMGGRNIGKSYQVKETLLSEAFINGSELVYLRREAEDIKTDLAAAYFADVDVKRITEGAYDDIIVYQKKIFWARHDEEGTICEKKLLGYTHALRLASHYKSIILPKVSDIIFEEFVPDGKPYLPKEPLKLQEYVSTIFRTREGTCWLIGNTISKLNPYVEDWKLSGVGRMKTHQIDVYTSTVQVQTEAGIEKHDVKVAVESCGAEGLLSKMAFGSGSNQIIKNEYRRFQMPTVDHSYIVECCEELYTMYMLYKNLKFKMCFMQDLDNDDVLFWYIKPADGDITIEDLQDERVICEEASFNPLHTQLHPISPKERKVFDFLARNKIFYSDDMTGTDFQSCFSSMMKG